MASLTPSDSWDDVYQLEKTDPIQAGAGGITNTPHQNNTNRTERIKETLNLVGIDVENKLINKNRIEYVDSLSELQALTGMAEYDVVYITGRTTINDGGQGYFVWMTGDYIAQVTADPLSGIYTPSDADLDGSEGCWVRQGLTRTFEQFGAKGDGATDDTASIQAAFSLCDLIEVKASVTYLITDTIEWTQTKVRGVKGFSTSFKWGGTSGKAMFEVPTANHMIGMDSIWINGNTSADILIYIIGTGTVRSMAFEKCIFQGSTSSAFLIGNYTNDGLDADIAPVSFSGCEFRSNASDIIIDSLDALLISAIDSFFTGSTVNSVYLKRGGSFKAFNSYFHGSPTTGDSACIRVKDGWVHIYGSEIEWGISGGGQMFDFEAPVATGISSRGEHSSLINGVRMLGIGETGTASFINMLSNKHSLTIQNSFLSGRSAGSLSLSQITNSDGANIVSINNVYTGRPFPANGQDSHITSLDDRVYDGTNTLEYTFMPANNTKTYATPSESSTIADDVSKVVFSSYACTATLPKAIGSSTSVYGLSGKRITLIQGGAATNNTVVPSGTDTISGMASITMRQYTTYVLESDGFSNWQIVSMISNKEYFTTSTGTGTVKMGSANNSDSSGWIEILPGKYVPYWSNVAP